jgi:glyoxylate carboligase
MMLNASDVLVERLIDWGVDTIFGLPGDGINGVFEALRKNKDRIRVILSATKNRLRLPPAHTRSLPGGWEFVSPRRVRAAFI